MAGRGRAQAWLFTVSCGLLGCGVAHEGEVGVYRVRSRDGASATTGPAVEVGPNGDELRSGDTLQVAPQAGPSPTAPQPPAPGSEASAGSLPDVTYHRDIRPVMQRLCVTCHGSDPALATAAPALSTFAEVTPFGEPVVRSVTTRAMPPFAESVACRPLTELRTTTAFERNLFELWQRDGFPEGDERDYVAPLSDLGELTSVLRTTTVFGQNNFGVRCFALESMEEDAFVTAWNLSTMLPVTSFTVMSVPEGSAMTDANCSPRLGKVLFRRSAEGRPLRYPNGSATSLVNLRNIVVRTAFDPALSGVVDGFPVLPSLELGVLAPGTQPVQVVNHVRAQTSVDLIAGQTGQSAEGVYIAPELSEIIAIDPFTGIFGTGVQVELRRATGEVECVLSLPSWRYERQEEYRFVEPIWLEQGDQLVFKCSYDNSVENQPIVDQRARLPRRVRTGQGWLDERCELDLWHLTPYP